MKINKKIITILFTSALVAGLAVYMLLSKAQNVLEDQIGAEALLLTEQIITEIDEEIYHRIEEMMVFAKDISLINDVSISNEKFDKIPDVQEFIDTTNNDWKSGKITPFISGILNNELSQKLNKHLEIYKQIYGYDLFGEMYVANKYGVAIATTVRLTNYLQADDPWYPSATAEKEFWVDYLEYDESSDTFSIGIVVKLYDDQGSFAGLLKGALNLEDIKYTLDLIQSQSPYKSMQSHLVNRNGLAICSGLNPLLKQEGRDISLTEFGTDISSRAPVAEAIRGNKGYMLSTEGGKELLSVFSSSEGFRDFKGLGWSIIIDFETDEIFGPIAEFKSDLAIIIVTIMIVFTVIGIFTFYSISKPIMKLRDASIEISKGELDTTVDFKSKDELGQLAVAFNEMTRTLSQRDSQLRKSEEKYRMLLENLPQKIFYKDKNSVYISCNDNFASDLAIAPEEIVGKTDFDFFPKALAEKYIFDDQRTMRSGQTNEIEETYVHNGQEYTVQTLKTPVANEDGNIIGALGIFWDITDRKRAEDELRKYRNYLEDSEKKFRAVVETAVVAIISADSEGKIIFWNKAAEKMFGYTREEIIIKELKTIMPERYRRAHIKGLKRVAKTGKTKIVNRPMELAGLRKDGTEFPIELTVSMWKMRQEIFFTALISDITERKQAEQEREFLLEQLREKTNEMENMLHIVTHDLRSPLVNVQGFTQELISDVQDMVKLTENSVDQTDIERLVPLRENIEQSENMISSSATKMSGLLTGLNSLAKLGRVELEIGPLDMNEMLESIVENTQFQINQYQASVILDPLPECMGDAIQINQVFTNLLVNALKYHHPDRLPNIHVSGKIQDDMNIYSLEDNGIGIPKSDTGKVFDIFHRVDPQGPVTGEGLGLSAARRIIERHQGKIWLESEPDKGTKFFVALPKVL